MNHGTMPTDSQDKLDASHIVAPSEMPIVPATTSLPEITGKALILSVLLSVVLAGANAYLGLFAGMTVSASIPAAVVSMTLFRMFKASNILENNIVQTAASSGEALAAGVIFTLPALLILGYWETFDYWQTTLLALVGGVLGVLFTIPLRRVLILDARLRFPEGVATAEVLKAGSVSSDKENSIRPLIAASSLGACAKFAESGLRLWSEAAEGAVRFGSTVFYGGANLSPALLAVGFIIKFEIAAVVFAGGVVGWVVLLPLYGLAQDALPPDALTAATVIWSQQIRYVGIGAMLVGGLWTLVQVRRPLLQGLFRLRRSSIGVFAGRTNTSGPDQTATIPRTEHDTPMLVLIVLLVVAWVSVMAVYQSLVENLLWAVVMSMAMTVAAFLFSTVAGYMAGLVGSSSNPVSGVTIATIMLSAVLLLLLMGPAHPAGPPAAILIGAVVCCAAAMGGDNLQDLKTGQIVGSTPWKQQVMQMVGVAGGAFAIVPILSLLHAKYGIGVPSDSHPHPLAAPQAMLMASLAQGVFHGGLPWKLVGLGALIAAGVILVEQQCVRRACGFRVPVLAVALGIYLPLKLTAMVMVGGLIRTLANRHRKDSCVTENSGLLFAAGLVTGEALMGIFLAIPVAVGSLWPQISSDPFQLFAAPPFGAWLGVLAVGLIGRQLYRHGRR
ncbi:MAG: oligopeptide transporter, OPT family [Nitrospiraceae bacterium]